MTQASTLSADAVERVDDLEDVAAVEEVDRDQVDQMMADALAFAGTGEQRLVRVDLGRVGGLRNRVRAHPVVDEEQRRRLRSAVGAAARRQGGRRREQ